MTIDWFELHLTGILKLSPKLRTFAGLLLSFDWSHDRSDDRHVTHQWCQVSKRQWDDRCFLFLHRSLSMYGNTSYPRMHWIFTQWNWSIASRAVKSITKLLKGQSDCCVLQLQVSAVMICYKQFISSLKFIIGDQYQSMWRLKADGCIMIDLCFISWPLYCCILGIPGTNAAVWRWNLTWLIILMLNKNTVFQWSLVTLSLQKHEKG